MYNFLRAVGVEVGPNQRWDTIDLSTINTSQILTKYRMVYAVLNDGIDNNEITLNLGDIEADLQVFSGTFVSYLASIGNKALPTTMGSPVIIRNNAIFSDAFKAGFWADSIDISVGAGVELPQELKPDVVIKPDNVGDRAGYDYLTLRNKVIPNVNGFYHASAADENGYYIVDGNKSRLKSGSNQIGLLSFATFGTIGIEPITPDMLSFEIDPITGLVGQVHIKFANSDLMSQTPILILGGYLLMVDQDSLFLNGPNVLTFKTYKYSFIERYFESKPYLDFSAFDVRHPNNDNDTIVASDLKTQAFLTGYFTMSQSYLVLVNSPYVITERSYPERQTVPHTFMSWEKPKWPLVVCEGKHEVYWSQYESNSWVLRCHDTYKKNYMFRTTAESDVPIVNSALYMANAGRYSDAYFFKIIEEIVQIQTS